MAYTVNERDVILQSSETRLEDNPGNYISLVADAVSFQYINGAPVPESITITAIMHGMLIGTKPTFSVVSGASKVYNGSTIDSGGNVSYIGRLFYYDLTDPNISAVIACDLDYLGSQYTAQISIGGLAARPASVVNFQGVTQGNFLNLNWDKNIEADLAGYEIRLADSNWGQDNNFIFRGLVNNTVITAPLVGSPKTWYIKAFDTNKLYSVNATTFTYTTSNIPNVTDLVFNYSDTSLTSATVTVSWSPVEPVFGLKEYELSYTPLVGPPVVILLKGTYTTLPADWIGSRSFTIKVIDNLGNKSSGYTESATKQIPDPVTDFRAQVIDNTVLLSWQMPVRTSLPISHVLLKVGSEGDTWSSGTRIIGTKSGEFTTVQELTKGTYVYWIAAVDTDGNQSIPISLTTTVNQPPDFIFNREFISTFSGTKTNALIDNGKLLLPVVIGETWTNHFINNSWTSPDDQVQAGYEVYLQPGTSSGTYVETFDYGSIISSTISVTMGGRHIKGNSNVSLTISTTTASTDTGWTTPVSTTSLFTTFRQVRVTITVIRDTAPGYSLYAIDNLSVRLDTKLKTDAGLSTTNSADTLGSIINFNSEFVDVSAINLTVNNTLARTVVYDFKDAVLDGTYSISSGIITVNVTAHGLITGQKVRIAGDTSDLPAQIVTLSSYTTNSYTASVSLPDGSGNISTYSNSMRVYVFDLGGTRQSNPVSWSIRGS